MKFLQRQVGIILLVILFVSPMVLTAQDSEPIQSGGSAIVAQVLDALVAAGGSGAVVDATVLGTSTGFDQFCTGILDVAPASRPIGADEETNCLSNSVEYLELAVGYDALVLIGNPDTEFAQCLTSENLNTIFEPSAQGQTTNWNQLNADNPDSALSLFVPDATSSTFALLDILVTGDGLRDDVTQLSSVDDVVSRVSSTPGALGVVNLEAAKMAGDSVRVFELNADASVGCIAPSVENIEGRTYNAAYHLYLYVNAASMSNPSLKSLLDFAVSADAAGVIEPLGYTPVSADTQDKNQRVLNDDLTGRQYSYDVVNFEPQFAAGEVVIGGASLAYTYLQSATSALTGEGSQLTITYKIEGEPAGMRRLCNGELDIAVATVAMSDEQSANCEANNITTYTLDLGDEAVVLLKNAGDPSLQCLTTDQVSTIWSSETADNVQKWSDVDSSFGDTDMTLFAPSNGDRYGDLMMALTSISDATMREDVETNDDALYRAAATANVDGALTLMSWQDYQRMLEKGQANVQLVGVDKGSGCVTPDVSTIVDGSYGLTRHAALIISQSALARPEVQTVLWELLRDSNYPALRASGFIGVDFADLPAVREQVRRLFFDAETAVANAPEVTPEPDPLDTPAETTPEPAS